MLSFLAILPRSLVTFLYALAALLRFYGDAETIPLEQYGFQYTVLDWSLLAFVAATVCLVVNLGLEWNSGNRSRRTEAEARERTARRTRIQARFAVLQVRHQLDPSTETRAALRDFVALLEEYGEF